MEEVFPTEVSEVLDRLIKRSHRMGSASSEIEIPGFPQSASDRFGGTMTLLATVALLEMPAATERMRREHQLAVVEVVDEGEGIPVDLLPRIFELYFTTKPKGSGIGLAMTYRILQLHGGALEVRSNAEANSPERGTVFTFRLPIAAGVGVEGRKVVATGAGQKEIGERV